jgi:hypothetical protein
MNKNTRYAIVFDEENNQNKKIEGIDIKKGMLFYLFESDGTPVRSNIDECYYFLATKDAYKNEDGIYVIEIEI